MIGRLFNWLLSCFLWFYWWLNKPFLAAFGAALCGHGEGLFKVDGKKVVREAEKFLRKMPLPVFTLVVGAVWAIPIPVPIRMPYNAILRFFVKIWARLRSHWARIIFTLSSKASQRRQLDTIFRRLNEQAAESQDDLIKGIVIMNQVKALLVGAYLETAPVWKGAGYSPWPQPPRAWPPPSGPQVVDPPRTENSDYLLSNAKTLREVASLPPQPNTYCIIGSGAGGAMAGYWITKEDPTARVIMLDAGPLVANNDFSVHMLDAMSELYMNGATTLSQNQLYVFRQARCIGGGTLVNNAVAARPTGFWWDTNLVWRWETMGVRLNWDSLNREYDIVGEMIDVKPLDPAITAHGMTSVAEGFRKRYPHLKIGPVSCNITRCIGCGRCNLGCQYDAKQSMNVTALPEFIKNGGLLVPNADVSRINFEGGRGNWTVRSITVDDEHGRSYEIKADKFILAAGCYASSKLLWRSGYTGAKAGVRTVGKLFSGNMGTVVIGRFKEPQRAWNGQQVGYLIEIPEERLVVETGYAPPPVVGWEAPQWGERLMQQIMAYDYLVSAIPVMATIGYGQIKRALAPSGFAIDFDMIEEDWRRLALGMRMSAEALFAAGAEEVYTTRFDAKVLRPGDDINDFFNNINVQQYLKVETAHLQGGNIIHPDPNRGVVDENMKVHGVSNMWIADASIIPSPITLNVAYTVLALASYAAKRIVRPELIAEDERWKREHNSTALVA